MKHIEKAVKLYKKFIDGARWLNCKMLKGDDCQTDLLEFDEDVCQPLDDLWEKLEYSEREVLDEITKMVGIFDGSIELSKVRGTFINLYRDDYVASPFCPACGKPGERYCLGEIAEKSTWGLFCLKCEPYNEKGRI